MKDFCNKVTDTTATAFLAEMMASFSDFWPGHLGVSQDDFLILTAPENLSYTKEYELELANIRLGKINKSAAEVVRGWYWILNNYRIIDVLDEKMVETQLREMTTDKALEVIGEAENHASTTKQEKEKLFTKLNLDDNKVRILNGLSSFIVLQDKRKELIVKMNSYLMRGIKKLLEKYNLDPTEEDAVISSSYPPWLYSETKENLVRLSQEALVGFCEFVVDGAVMVGTEAVKKFKELVDDNLADYNKEIKGQVAFRGIVRGKVCVVNKQEDFVKFNEGDILVTSMTRPEYVPIMQKAIAFVTDEGGVTCHAAIISREMKKPCVIGTKIATQVLKDGDVVEVDANSGIIKILG